jgi:large subunit ribosomal protein L10
MTKIQKNILISALSSEFAASKGIVISAYKGMKVGNLETLRNEARLKDIKVKVVKNTLASIALKKADIEGLELKDTNLVLWGTDQLEVCKLAAKYAGLNEDKMVIKSGYLEGKVTDSATIVALSKLPSKSELIGMLLSVWTAPARMFVTGLDELRKQKEAA